MFLFRRPRKVPQASPDPLDRPSTPIAPETQVADQFPHRDTALLRPRDLQESNRLDFQQFLLRQILKGHYVAPISSPHSVLDVGCGTGRWILDMGQEFPSTQFVGIDIDVPTFTEQLDPRYHFVRVDLLKGIPFPPKSFEFVHTRFMITHLPAAIWPSLIKQLIQTTASGGWIEFVDTTHLITSPGAAGQQVQQWSEQMWNQRGIDLLLPQHLGSMLKASPLLEDVHFMYLDVPLGDWGGRMGTLMAKNHLTAYENLKPLYQQLLNIDARIINQVFEDLPQEWELFQSSCRIYMAYGRRIVE